MANSDNASLLLKGLRTNQINSLLGFQNLVEANKPARSNAHAFGLSTWTDGALAATGVGCVVAIPVQPGDTISRVGILVGATAGATMTNQFAALYAGTGAKPALLGQSKDTTSAAIAAEKLAEWTLESPIELTATTAPNGFIYVEVAITAATIPTAAAVATPKALQPSGGYGPNAPLFLSATAGSALAGTAQAEITSPTSKAVAPIVILR
ncbi:MAG TPA: hypothetical protein VGN13_12510 [Solirubrobacteraceae bacterium]|jgi:hypothetical protein